MRVKGASRWSFPSAWHRCGTDSVPRPGRGDTSRHEDRRLPAQDSTAHHRTLPADIGVFRFDSRWRFHCKPITTGFFRWGGRDWPTSALSKMASRRSAASDLRPPRTCVYGPAVVEIVVCPSRSETTLRLVPARSWTEATVEVAVRAATAARCRAPRAPPRAFPANARGRRARRLGAGRPPPREISVPGPRSVR